MSDQRLELAADFPAPSDADWRALVEKALKGASLEKALVTPTPEGIDLKALYTREDWPAAGDPSGFPGLHPRTRGAEALGNAAAGWDVAQLHAHPDIATTNAAILTDLERGTTSLTLRFDRAFRRGLGGDDAGFAEAAGRDGIACYTEADLEALLDGVLLDLAPVVLEPGARFAEAARLLNGLWDRRGIAAGDAKGGFGADPLGTLAAEGALPEPLADMLAEAAALAAETAQTRPAVQTFTIDTGAYAGAGATRTQQLAIAMATAVAYLRAMLEAGLDIDAACRQLRFRFDTSTEFFPAIAMLRAARTLFSRIAEASGASEEARRMHLQARTAERVISRRDPYVNMLRATISCFAAGLGGADSVLVLPYDHALGLPDDFARRIARNTQLILMEESNIHRVVDPAGGSWFVERLTAEMEEKAWDIFRGIESKGGLSAVLRDGSLAQDLAAAWAGRETDIAKRKRALTGVNEFPNLEEKPLDLLEVDYEAIAQDAAKRAVAAGWSGAGESLDAPLPHHRDAEVFERLRDAAEAAGGLAIFQANIGRIADHTARASFSRNLFAAGGIASVANDGFADADAMARAFGDSGAKIAVINGADEGYAEHAEAFAKALKAAGAAQVWLAGRGGDNEDAWRAAGVDGFVYTGCDARAALESAQAALGVKTS
jgi:methylmalonyl-CoA mutase